MSIPLRVLVCDDELMVMAGEDPKGCFYSYLMPEAWRGYFVLERTVSRQAAGLLASGPPIRSRIRTCPMGWINAVDFIEELTRAPSSSELLRRSIPSRRRGRRSPSATLVVSTEPSRTKTRQENAP